MNNFKVQSKIIFAILIFTIVINFNQFSLADQNLQNSDKVNHTQNNNINFQHIKILYGHTKIPFKKVIVCADDYKYYPQILQNHVNSVFSEMDIVVLDGLKDNSGLDKDSTTFVYYGNPKLLKQNTIDGCLNKYPELKFFVESKLEQVEIKKNNFKYLGFVDGQETNNLKLFAGFCFLEKPQCELLSYSTFFRKGLIK